MANNLTYIRRWEFSRNTEPTLSELETGFKETLEALDSDIRIQVNDSTLVLRSPNAQYMSVLIDCGTVDGKPVVDMSVSGKGEQIKASELEKYYVKSLGAMNRFLNSVNKVDYFRQLTHAKGLAYGVGAVVGSTIGGSVRLIAKGVKALLRDQEAYQKELGFYIRAMGIGDFVVGGKDSDGLIPIIEAQASKDNTIAQYTLGMAYANGIGVSPSESEAIRWFERAAEAGELRSKNIVAGAWLYGEKDYGVEKKNLGVQYLVDLAEAGEDWAPQQIIEIYKDGSVSGIPADYQRAIEYAAKYADQGYLYAINVLAEASDTTRGPVESSAFKDDALAATLYDALLKESDNDYTETAAMSLADMYLTGRGVPSNKEKAAELFQRARRLGNADAKIALLDIYCQDLGTEHSREEVRSIIREVKRSGSATMNAAAVYASYCVEDVEGQYGKSLEYAQQYIASPYADAAKKTSAEKYVRTMEAHISQMTDEERREFLNERKKLSDNPKAVKGLLVGIGVAVISLVTILLIKFFADNRVKQTTVQSIPVQDEVISEISEAAEDAPKEEQVAMVVNQSTRRISQITRSYASQTAPITFEYDENGLLTKSVVKNYSDDMPDEICNYGYDSNGMIISIDHCTQFSDNLEDTTGLYAYSDAYSDAYSYEYDDAGRVVYEAAFVMDSYAERNFEYEENAIYSSGYIGNYGPEDDEEEMFFELDEEGRLVTQERFVNGYGTRTEYVYPCLGSRAYALKQTEELTSAGNEFGFCDLVMVDSFVNEVFSIILPFEATCTYDEFGYILSAESEYETYEFTYITIE